MPMYEYECKACGARFEQIQKYSDPPIEICRQCGERSVQKLLSSPAIQFKGSGWYVTDYARSKEAKESGESKEAGKESKESGKESKEPAQSGTAKESKESKDSSVSAKSTDTSSTSAPSSKES
jgi:putative FmdB family regulatory protein